MGVAHLLQPGEFEKNFGVSGDLMEYNERGKPLKRLSSLTNPKSAGLYAGYITEYKSVTTNIYTR